MSQEPHSTIDIKLKRVDRIYRPDEKVEGTVVINAYKGWGHTGVVLIAEGIVHLSTTSRGIIGLGSEYTGQPVQILKIEQELCGAGRFADGPTEIPFEFQLKASAGQPIIESYHGVYVSVLYSIQITCERGMMKTTLRKDLEFIVEVPVDKQSNPTPTSFDISPESLENVNSSILASIPKFKITGRLHRTHYPINQPFTGEVIIQQSIAPIRSLELQLVRVESVTSGGYTSREATEIQNIQIGEGNICRDMVVPMYMVFPRLFSCPTVITTPSSSFKIEFEVNLIVVFGDGYMITENFPITLYREK